MTEVEYWTSFTYDPNKAKETLWTEGAAWALICDSPVDTDERKTWLTVFTLPFYLLPSSPSSSPILLFCCVGIWLEVAPLQFASRGQAEGWRCGVQVLLVSSVFWALAHKLSPAELCEPTLDWPINEKRIHSGFSKLFTRRNACWISHTTFIMYIKMRESISLNVMSAILCCIHTALNIHSHTYAVLMGLKYEVKWFILLL